MNQDLNEMVLFRDESYAIQGAVFDVYREMGSGFLESVYQECLALEFCRRKISFTRSKICHLSTRANDCSKTIGPILSASTK